MNCKVMVDDEKVKAFRLNITKAVKITLTNALTLLGIETVEEM
jgi:arginyl-tRNA synthetase